MVRELDSKVIQKKDELLDTKNQVANQETIIDEQSKRITQLDQWKNQKLKLEIAGIDNQHKELIYILQQINDLQHTSDSRMKIYLPVIIKKLFYYTQFNTNFSKCLYGFI